MARILKYLLLISLTSALTGCTSYRFFVLDSPLPRGENNAGFVRDEGDLAFKYVFDGLNMFMFVSVENRTEEPLFIDLSGSALFMNGTPLRFSPLKAVFAGGDKAHPLTVRTGAEGVDEKIRQVYRIGPGRTLNMAFDDFNPEFARGSDFRLSRPAGAIEDLALRHFRRAELKEDSNVYEANIRVSRNEDLSQSRVSKAVFRDSHAYRSATGPEYFPKSRGDTYFLSRTSGQGLFLSTLLTGLIIAAILSDPEPAD